MKIKIARVQKDQDFTIGAWAFDDEPRSFWTMEDTVRGDGVKVYGETAIPAGTYKVDITWSPRFKRPLPILINVQGFVGIRIHPGNTPEDTEGCILVGMDRLSNSIGRSRLAFDAIFPRIQSALFRHEPVTLEIH